MTFPDLLALAAQVADALDILANVATVLGRTRWVAGLTLLAQTIRGCIMLG